MIYVAFALILVGAVLASWRHGYWTGQRDEARRMLGRRS